MTPLSRRRVEYFCADGKLDAVSYVVHGPAGAVEFHYSVRPIIDKGGGMVDLRGGTHILRDRYGEFAAMALGIELHSRTPLYEDHKPRDGCFCVGGMCYHDGTGMGGARLLDDAVHGMTLDESIVWSTLQEWYRNRWEAKP